MLLLPDGTVMAAGGPGLTNWYHLTPDSHGSYASGTWTTLTPMNYPRLYYSSQVLTNGQVFVAGGEYSPAAFTGPGTTNGEIYNPQLNTWTLMPSTPSLNDFFDSCSEMLPNGNVLVSPVEPAAFGGTLIWNTASQTWSAGPTLHHNDQDEASWAKLPDNSILTIDTGSTTSERYIPSLNQWVTDATVPVQIYDTTNVEMGPGFMLPNGKAIFFGGTGNSALYSPSGTTNAGTWTAGPVLPNGLVSADAPGAMMVNGKVLLAMTPPLGPHIFTSPTYFYEYDSVANSFTEVNGPTGLTFPSPSYPMRMLDLPDGTVLLSTSSSQLYVYQPGGTPLAAGQPTINSLSQNGDGSYHLTGTLFNGISEGAAYGDDAQMNSNYPLVRMTNLVTGLVYYARTYNWSSTGVMTSNNVVGTDFVPPAGLPTGLYSLVVTANGNASAPITFGDSLVITSTNLGFSGYAGGPFTPASTSLTLTNIGGTSLNWAVGQSSSWLTLSTTSGTLSPGGSATVTASINANANALAAGPYMNVLLFTNLSSNLAQGRTVTLQVNPVPSIVQNGGFETGDFTDWVLNGTGFDENFVDNGTYPSGIKPHSGRYFALRGQVGSLADLSQTLTTVSGQQYSFSSWVNSPDGGTPNECRISWNGTTLFDGTNMPAIGWTNLVFIVTATGSSTVIDFAMRDDASWLGLDDVSVTPLPAALAFKTVAASGGSILLSWNSVSNLVYQLQFTTNLTSGTWLNLGSSITATNSTVTTTDPNPSDSQRFYRVMLVP
jgi:hypothetical protein